MPCALDDAALVLLALTASAPAQVSFNWAPVGDPGNTPDPSTGSVYGAVSYNYLISKYDVTNSQYTTFLNAADPTGTNPHALYNSHMGNYPGFVSATGGIDFNSGAAIGTKYSIKSGEGNLPVVWVSWYDAARFVNWMNNGQGSGSTESGVYDMSLTSPTCASGASIFLPSEDEWYKAAYYDPTKGGSNYWTYATRSDTLPDNQAPPGGSNSANYHHGNYAVTASPSFDAGQTYLNDVGAYTTSTNYYGTFDQNGDVFQWNETLTVGSSRGFRGGSWDNQSDSLSSASRNGDAPASEDYIVGFRVASVPEPSSALVLLMLSGATLARRRIRV